MSDPTKCPKCSSGSVRQGFSAPKQIYWIEFACGRRAIRRGKRGRWRWSNRPTYDCFERLLAQAEERERRLRKTADRLPKTADGKLVFVGMSIFIPLPNRRRGDGSSVVLEETVAGIVADGVFTHETISQTAEWGDIYSVYDLAEKARAASEGAKK